MQGFDRNNNVVDKKYGLWSEQDGLPMQTSQGRHIAQMPPPNNSTPLTVSTK